MYGAVTEEKVRKLANYWLNRYGLLPFDLEIEIILRREEVAEEDRDSQASISVNDGYRSALLTVHDYNVRTTELNEVIFHEISHIIHWRVFDWLEDLTREKDAKQIRKYKEDIVTHLEMAMFPKSHRKKTGV